MKKISRLKKKVKNMSKNCQRINKNNNRWQKKKNKKNQNSNKKIIEMTIMKIMKMIITLNFNKSNNKIQK